MITEDYVSLETAKLLKEHGFLKGIDLRLTQNLSFYDNYGLCHNLNKYYDALIQDKIDFVVAPTLQMAMKWLRKVHSVFITILHRFSNNADNDINFSYVIDECNKNRQYTDGEFTSYEEAVEAAIIKVLKKLP